MDYAFCRSCWSHLYGEAIARHGDHYVTTSTWWKANEAKSVELRPAKVDYDVDPEEGWDEYEF
jgi:hypothetical protein